MRHFDAHAYRTEDANGVWDFARGCMRSYLILKEKARQFREDPEIQALVSEIRQSSEPASLGAYSPARAAALKGRSFDRAALAARPLPYERLDQLVIDLLLGAR
jgi:xylose isomerase